MNLKYIKNNKMQTKILITIEKTKSAPYEFEMDELDYTLMPELEKYLLKYGQKGIDRIKEFMLYTIDNIQRSFDYKQEKKKV